MSSILSPRLFIRSNSGCEISLNDGSFNIVPASGFMLLKCLIMLVVQLVARQNLSFVSTTLTPFSDKETLQQKSVGQLALSFWVAATRTSDGLQV